MGFCPSTVIPFVRRRGSLFGPNDVMASDYKVGAGVYHALRGRSFSFDFVNTRPVTNERISNCRGDLTALFSGTSFVYAPAGTPGSGASALARLTHRVNFTHAIMAAPRRRSRVVTFASRVTRILTYSCILDPLTPVRANFSTNSCHSISHITEVGNRV